MPPPGVKTIRDLIYYQYAKLIASEAGYASNYGFIMSRFKDLKTGRLLWSNLTREYRKELLRGRACVFCGSAQSISLDHLIPVSRGGPDTADNLVSVCRSCNSSKGDKDVYLWWVKDLGKDKDELPRVVAGKYLKLIYDTHKGQGTLSSGDLDGDGELSVLDLGTVHTAKTSPSPQMEARKGPQQIVLARDDASKEPSPGQISAMKSDYQRGTIGGILERYYGKEEIQNILYGQGQPVSGPKSILIERVLKTGVGLKQVLEYAYKDTLKVICEGLELESRGTREELTQRILDNYESLVSVRIPTGKEAHGEQPAPRVLKTGKRKQRRKRKGLLEDIFGAVEREIRRGFGL